MTPDNERDIVTHLTPEQQARASYLIDVNKGLAFLFRDLRVRFMIAQSSGELFPAFAAQIRDELLGTAALCEDTIQEASKRGKSN